MCHLCDKLPQPRTIIDATPEHTEAIKRGEFLTPDGARAIKKIASRRINYAIGTGELPAFAITTKSQSRKYRWLIKREDLDAWEPSTERIHRDAEPMPSLGPSRSQAPSPLAVAKARALYHERERRRAELAALVPARPWPQEIRPCAWIQPGV